MYSPCSGLTLNQEARQTVNIPIPYAQDTNTACKPAITNVINYVNFTGRGDKSSARSTSRCILFDGENISFDASLVIYINSTNISPIMIINRIYENQNLLLL
jgi:hypothetical protein